MINRYRSVKFSYSELQAMIEIISKASVNVAVKDNLKKGVKLDDVKSIEKADIAIRKMVDMGVIIRVKRCSNCPIMLELGDNAKDFSKKVIRK